MKNRIIKFAHSLGFERIGVTSTDSLKKEEAFLKKWIAEGRAGEMEYLERHPERRSRPAELLPGAKSVIALAMSYDQNHIGVSEYRGIGETTEANNSETPIPPYPDTVREGRVSRYTAGRDYHKVIGKKLEAFTRYLEALSPGVESKTFVDTGPLLERAFAQRAGLGFIGKNTMLITKGLGSWVFLASVITTLELPQDAPDDRSCGTCRLCIDACPTEAITAPFELDARRCIAYLTIEQDGPIPENFRDKMNGWMFGCDICQEVCPHNSGQRSSSKANHINLSEILSIESDEGFRNRFAGTAFMRAGRAGLIRNACVAAANFGRTDLLPILEKLSQSDRSAIVREHAEWAARTLSVLSFR